MTCLMAAARLPPPAAYSGGPQAFQHSAGLTCQPRPQTQSRGSRPRAPPGGGAPGRRARPPAAVATSRLLGTHARATSRPGRSTPPPGTCPPSSASCPAFPGGETEEGGRGQGCTVRAAVPGEKDAAAGQHHKSTRSVPPQLTWMHSLMSAIQPSVRGPHRHSGAGKKACSARATAAYTTPCPEICTPGQRGKLEGRPRASHAAAGAWRHTKAAQSWKPIA